jgi:molybdenum cofactor synthesis domain-containing protein
MRASACSISAACIATVVRRSTSPIGYHAAGKNRTKNGASLAGIFPYSERAMVTSAPDPAPTAAIGLIGDEILSGKVVDENARLLIADLRLLGVALRRIVVLPDVLDDIATTVRALSDAHTHVFTSGGVGPTHDDLTMEGIARAFGTRVVRHPLLEHKLRAYYGDRLKERNLRMAEVPEGCALVGEDESTLGWPVVAYRNVYILPGVPQIFRRKWEAIRERFRHTPFHLKSVFTTLDEGSIAHHLDRVVAEHAAVQVGSYPRLDDPTYRVKITLESKEGPAVEAALAVLIELLGTGVVRVE